MDYKAGVASQFNKIQGAHDRNQVICEKKEKKIKIQSK